MDPHYTRKDTHRKFLGSELNITKKYRIYKNESEKQKRRPVGAAKYRKNCVWRVQLFFSYTLKGSVSNVQFV